ncbi:MAG TPA: MFS transporter [Burkholderiaceae bacterium]|nr:MFS transporter [Burkholderiaceae bacterium]
MLAHAAFAGARVAMTLTAIGLQASTLTVGLLLSMYSLLPTLLAIPGGRWIDRTGVRWPMTAGVVLVIAGILVPFVWLSLATLYVTAVLVGVGFLAYHLCAQKLAGELGGPDDRRHVFTLLAIGFSVSGFIGPTAAGFLIDGLGYRLAFGVIALAPIATLWRLHQRRSELSALGYTRAQGGPLRIWDLLRTAELRRLYLAVALLSAAWDVHQFLVPIYGASVGISASGIGLILGAFSVATLVVRLVLPLFLAQMSEWRAILVAHVVAAGVYAFYPRFDTLETLIALSFVLGLGLGISQPMVLSILHRVAPPHRIGEAAGLRVMLVNGTQTVLPGAFGALGGLFGVSLLFWGMAALVGAGGAAVGRHLVRQARNRSG